MKARAQRIFSRLVEPVDAILLMNSEEPLLDASFFYATGLKGGLFEECPAILWPDGRVQLITSRLEETSARTSSAEVTVFSNKAERDALLADALKGVQDLGFNAAGIIHSNVGAVKRAAPHARLVDVGDAIKAARLVKDAGEIDAIRRACIIASKVADEIPSILREGISESEMGAELAYQMQKLGATSVSFETISAFGPGSAEPHYLPGDRKLRPGEPALFDFGCAAESTGGHQGGRQGLGCGCGSEGPHRKLRLPRRADPLHRPRPRTGGARRGQDGAQRQPRS